MAKPIDYARRDLFDGYAETYDRYRPSYPRELYQTLFGYMDAKPGARALEIGVGTGHATEPFLRRGVDVTAVEIGRNLAAFAQRRFAAYPGFRVANVSFEDFAAPDESYDLVYAASSFHWIPEEIGFPKAYRLLKPGGAIALFWNRHFVNREDDALHRRIQAVYDQYMPGKKRQVLYDQERYGRKLTTLESYGFREDSFHLFHGMTLFNADDYIGLLNTYSDYLIMPDAEKAAMQADIRAAIEANENRLNVYDTLELYLGKK